MTGSSAQRLIIGVIGAADAFARKLDKPLVLLDSWQNIDETLAADTPQQAVDTVFSLLCRDHHQ